MGRRCEGGEQAADLPRRAQGGREGMEKQIPGLERARAHGSASRSGEEREQPSSHPSSLLHRRPCALGARARVRTGFQCGSRIVSKLASRCGAVSSCSRNHRSNSPGGQATTAEGEGSGLPRVPEPKSDSRYEQLGTATSIIFMTGISPVWCVP
jgi:hypothetical protein